MPVEQLIIRAGKKPLSPRGIMRRDGYGVNSQPRLVGLARRQWGCGDHTKDSHRYILTIPYQTDEELDHIIYEDILAEAHRIAGYPLKAGQCIISTPLPYITFTLSRSGQSGHVR